MKLQNDLKVETNMGGLETHTVGIKANGKAFRAFVKGIYSDKIRAFVREICTNALDAHTQAGRPEDQFHVDFPTALDPYFRVRDYGVSMSHATVFDIFGTLFESTKDDSNDVVGAFGLGSKSPFAYADAFEVTAHLDGERRAYLVTLNADGVPQITLVSTTVTDRPNGVEVAIPIRTEDFGRVIEQGKDVLAAFDVLPTTNGVDIPVRERLHTVESGMAWVTRRVGGQTWGKALFIRQGCVMYPVDDYEIKSPMSALRDGFDMVLDVPIGTVGVTTSREALELDEPTRQALISMVEGAIGEIEVEISDRFACHKTRLEAVADLVENGIADFWSGKIMWNGEELNEWLALDGFNKSFDRTLLPSVKVGNTRGTTVLNRIRYSDVPSKRFVIERDERVKRATLRYRAVVDEFGKDNVFKLSNPDRKTLDRLMRLWGVKREQILSVASLPDPGPPERGARGTGPLQGVNKLDGHRLRPIDGLPDEYYWTVLSRPGRGELYAAQNLGERVIGLGGDRDVPFLVFNPTAVKRYKPDAEAEIEAVRTALMADREDDMAEALVNQVRWADVPRALREALDAPSVDGDLVVMANEYFSYDDRQTLIADAQAENEALRVKYPLIFNPYDAEAQRQYVAAMDAAAEADGVVGP